MIFYVSNIPERLHARMITDWLDKQPVICANHLMNYCKILKNYNPLN